MFKRAKLAKNRQISGKVETKGLTIVPLKVYFDKQLVKVEIAVCRGKQLFDKRNVVKERDVRRNIERELKENS